MPHIRSGALRGIGVASDKRNTAIPDVPTYGEMGYPNVYSGSWVGFFAPAKTPDAVVAKLNAEINAVMKEPDSLDKLAKAGFDPVVKNVAEANAYYKSEVESWGKMVNADRLLELTCASRVMPTTGRTLAMSSTDARHKAGMTTEACAMNAAPKTLRHLSDLEAAGLTPAEKRAALEKVAAQYAVAITPAMAELIDRADPNDPIARQFVPDAAELDVTPEERADPIGDHAHSPVEGIVHRYPDRVLLKLTHVCAVYCRFCFRREMIGPPPSR